MAITAQLDNVGKDGEKFVAYVQYYDGSTLIESVCHRYDPEDPAEFKAAIVAKIDDLSSSMTTIKAKADQAVTEAVAEIAAKQTKETK